MNLEETKSLDASISILVLDELRKAREKHNNIKSYHEGYAVILEELDELWEEVKAQVPDRHKIRKEAMQVATTAIRLISDLT